MTLRTPPKLLPQNDALRLDRTSLVTRDTSRQSAAGVSNISVQVNGDTGSNLSTVPPWSPMSDGALRTASAWERLHAFCCFGWSGSGDAAREIEGGVVLNASSKSCADANSLFRGSIHS